MAESGGVPVRFDGDDDVIGVAAGRGSAVEGVQERDERGRVVNGFSDLCGIESGECSQEV